jgi:hypothetical protein
MALVTQVSVRISAEDGSVSGVTRALGEAGVDIRGFSVSDSAEHGVLRLIVDKPDLACEVLAHAGMTPCTTPVVVVELPDLPGGLAGVLKAFAEAGVSIEYVYSLISTYVVLNVVSPETAEERLAGSAVRLVSAEEISTGVSS